jgi:hypothetical protein
MDAIYENFLAWAEDPSQTVAEFSWIVGRPLCGPFGKRALTHVPIEFG